MITFIITVGLVVSVIIAVFIFWISWGIKRREGMNITEDMSSAEIRDEYRKEVSRLTVENVELREQLKQVAERSSRVEQYEVTQEQQRTAEFNQRAER